MIEATKLYQVWVYLQAEPLFWLTLTIGAYLLANRLYQASGLFPLLNPVAMSILFVSACLMLFGVEYERYFDGAKFIHFLLGPTTVALSVPIYLNWATVLKAKRAILISVSLGSLFAIGITYAMAHLLQLDPVTVKSLLPRNMAARGFAFGLASHGIGTARAMSKDSQAGVFAAVAMGLSGIVTAAIIPLAFIILRDFTSASFFQ